MPVVSSKIFQKTCDIMHHTLKQAWLVWEASTHRGFRIDQHAHACAHAHTHTRAHMPTPVRMLTLTKHLWRNCFFLNTCTFSLLIPFVTLPIVLCVFFWPGMECALCLGEFLYATNNDFLHMARSLYLTNSCTDHRMKSEKCTSAIQTALQSEHFVSYFIDVPFFKKNSDIFHLVIFDSLANGGVIVFHATFALEWFSFQGTAFY